MSVTPSSPRRRPGPISAAAAAMGALRNRVHIAVTPELSDTPPAPTGLQARMPRPIEWPPAVPQSGSSLRVAGDYGHERRR